MQIGFLLPFPEERDCLAADPYSHTAALTGAEVAVPFSGRLLWIWLSTISSPAPLTVSLTVINLLSLQTSAPTLRASTRIQPGGSGLCRGGDSSAPRCSWFSFH